MCGSSECEASSSGLKGFSLVIIGGTDEDSFPVDTVQIYDGDKFCSAPSLPISLTDHVSVANSDRCSILSYLILFGLILSEHNFSYIISNNLCLG